MKNSAVMLKVLHIVKYYHPSKGGMETYVRQLCRNLPRYGIEPAVLTVNHIPAKPYAEDTVDGIAVHRCPVLMKILSQPVTTGFASRLLAEAEKADIVHLHSPFPNAEVVLSRFTKRPLVITWCAEPLMTRWRPIMPLYKPFLTACLKSAKRILPLPGLLENSPTLAPFRDKCSEIALAFKKRAEESGELQRLLPQGRPPVVLFVGNLRRYKGVEVLVRAVPLLSTSVEVHIVGEGEESERLRELTKELGLEQRVKFHSTVDDDELPKYYRSADLFVLPSINASEAFGIVQAEAMSYGLPIVNTNVPSGVPIVSLDGLTGLTVTPNDSAALAAAIDRLLQDAALYEACSTNALIRAAQFSEEKMAERYAAVYKSLKNQ